MSLNRRLALTRSPGYLISTEFTGSVYETTIFGLLPTGDIDWMNLHFERVHTESDALAAHSRAVEKFLAA